MFAQPLILKAEITIHIQWLALNYALLFVISLVFQDDVVQIRWASSRLGSFFVKHRKMAMVAWGVIVGMAIGISVFFMVWNWGLAVFCILRQFRAARVAAQTGTALPKSAYCYGPL